MNTNQVKAPKLPEYTKTVLSKALPFVVFKTEGPELETDAEEAENLYEDDIAYTNDTNPYQWILDRARSILK